MKFRVTRHQVARGSRPDGVGDASWYLIKAVSRLRLTYQIRLLTFGAGRSGARLVIVVPRSCQISQPLRRFLKEHKKFVELTRRD